MFERFPNTPNNSGDLKGDPYEHQPYDLIIPKQIEQQQNEKREETIDSLKEKINAVGEQITDLQGEAHYNLEFLGTSTSVLEHIKKDIIPKIKEAEMLKRNLQSELNELERQADQVNARESRVQSQILELKERLFKNN